MFLIDWFRQFSLWQRKRDFPKLPFLILSVLEQRGPSHGYELTQGLVSVSGDSLKYGQASLYPALNLMLEQGWITCVMESPVKGPKRNVYTISENGKVVLGRMAEEKEKLNQA